MYGKRIFYCVLRVVEMVAYLFTERTWLFEIPGRNIPERKGERPQFVTADKGSESFLEPQIVCAGRPNLFGQPINVASDVLPFYFPGFGSSGTIMRSY